VKWSSSVRISVICISAMTTIVVKSVKEILGLSRNFILNLPHRRVFCLSYSNPDVAKARNKTLRIIGHTYSGRFLTIFLAPRGRGSYFVVTAREATEVERRRFYK
jgi:hypothetical protein